MTTPQNGWVRSMKNETETLTLRRWIQTGDADAFSEISRLYAGMVYGTCLRITGDKDQAADAAQETFFQLLKSAGKVTGSLGSWLHQVATRRAIDLVRRDVSRRRREEAFAASAIQETDNWADISPVVDEAIGELDEELRDILLCHFLQGRSMTEIAAARGVSQPTISRRVDHALTELRERLRSKGVLVALPVLTALMANAAQAVPDVVLAELGKMSLAASGAAASAVGTSSGATINGASAATGIALLAGAGFKIACISAIVIVMAGIGGWFAYKYNLSRKSAPPKPAAAQPPTAAGPGPTRIVVGGAAGALGFGGVGAVTSAISTNEQVDLGRTYGNAGDWRRAFECFQKEITAGRTDGWSEWEWAWATSSALAAGETNACREWCRQLLDQLGSSENPEQAERCAKLCLALPGISGELLSRAVERADFAIADDPNNRYRQLAKGMAEYRLGKWANVLKRLYRSQRSSQFDIAIQAWGFVAMTRHQLGDAAGARVALDGLRRRLNALAHTGELGDRQRTTWDGCARAMALRAEAERLILGKEVSPPLDPARVREQRTQWQFVMQLVYAAERLAQLGRWAEARDAYVQALAHPDFDWDPLLFRPSVVSQQVAATFLMAGDEARHLDLCRTLLERPAEILPTTTQERNAWVYLVKMDHLPPDLKTRALTAVQLIRQSAEEENSAWLWLVCGLAAYREGRTDDALFALDHAGFGGDVTANARLSVIRAMTCQRTGQTNEAAAALQEAEDLFAQKTPGNSGWWNDGFYQITLQELRSMQRSPGGQPTMP